MKRLTLLLVILLLALLAACKPGDPVTPVPPTVSPDNPHAGLPDFTAVNSNWALDAPILGRYVGDYNWPCQQPRYLAVPEDWGFKHNTRCGIAPGVFNRGTAGDYDLWVEVDSIGRPVTDNPRGEGDAIQDVAGFEFYVPSLTLYPGVCYGSKVAIKTANIVSRTGDPIYFSIHAVLEEIGELPVILNTSPMLLQYRPDLAEMVHEPLTTESFTDVLEIPFGEPQVFQYASEAQSGTPVAQTAGEVFLGVFTVLDRTTADFGFLFDIVHATVDGGFMIDNLRIEKLPPGFCGL